MPSTLPADFNFDPKVWSDHTMAYFDRNLVFGAVAIVDRTLTEQPGTVKNFPYFKTIGDAQEPTADEALVVDKLQDDSFSCTVKEIGKAVGFTKAAYYKSAASRERIDKETQMQIARVMAEKVDKDLVTEINTDGNYTLGFTSVDTELATVERILTGKVTAFGDKHEQAIACYMHSLNFLNMMTNSTSGFLKADANDPLWRAPNFAGRLLGMALFVTDTVPAATAVNGKKTFQCFIVKAAPYGIMVKQDADMEADYDILHREFVVAGTQWYGVKAFHSKIAALDKRIARLSLQTNVAV